MTCCGVDCRTYTIARLLKWQVWSFVEASIGIETGCRVTVRGASRTTDDNSK